MVIFLNVHDRIRQLMDDRGWSEYKLAKESGLSQSTISNLFNRNTSPSIPTLESICNGFGISLGQFFSTDNSVFLSDEQKEFFDDWLSLNVEEKQLIAEIVKRFKSK